MDSIRLRKRILLLFIAGLSLLSTAQITPHEAVLQMQKGINLGNTFEPPYEASWNNPKAEEYYFDLYEEAGFQCVRIPVRWDNYTEKVLPYTVNSTWLNRIEQVVDWGLDRGLFIVINSHHDNWIKEEYTEANQARFDSIWTQISYRFKDKPEKLLFEVLNEPHGLSKTNNDEMHQRILSIIRKTNPTRLVIFQGNNWGGSDDLINAAIPDDDYLIGSFHSYDPYLFGLEGEGTWGSASDISELDRKFKAVSDWSSENNIPVFLGEFGSLKVCDFNSRMRHYKMYVELSQKYGFASAAWDDGGDFRIMERQQKEWDEVKDILIYCSSGSPKILASVFQDSIVKVSWTNKVFDHDSIFVQRRLGTQRDYTNIATLKSDTNLFYDYNPEANKYYSYRVIAHYNDSADIYSHPFMTFFPAWVRPVRLPFNDTLMVIPGIIEAEDFDYGGEGLSFHDADVTNIAGDYRPDEAVDIYDRLGTGFHIGNAIAGEWYEYSVDVQIEGWYDVTTYLAAMYGGGTFQISIDTIQSEVLTAPTCYSWLTTKTVSTKMYLYAGNQIMRFTVLSEPLFNIDKMVFDLKTDATEISLQKENPFVAYQNNLGELIIKQDQNSNIEMFTIYSISGSLIQSVKYPESITRIPSYNFTQGIYLIQGVSENQKYNQKVVIN